MKRVICGAVEPVTLVGTLLVNPTSFHRKVLRLEGIARNVGIYSGSETGVNQVLCGADFELEDATGKIEVTYHVRCQSGQQQATSIAEGMSIVIDGHMEAPPTVLRTQDGNDLGVRILAHTVMPLKK